MTDLPNNWKPRRYQFELWKFLQDGGARALARWHRRSGKDDVALHWTAFVAHKRVGTYWHMLPEAAQARKAIWDAVNPKTGLRRIDEAFPRELRETTREQDMLIRFVNGSTWQVVGSDNFNSLVGSPPAGVVFSEWALAKPGAWAYLRPILRENGGWAIFISTPRGRNHMAAMELSAKGNPEWFVSVLPATATNVFTPEDLEAEKRDYIKEYGKDDGEALFNQEYMVSYDAAILGSFYGTLMSDAEKDGRIGRVPHDPRYPVETWFDLGVTDSTAIWFVQRCGQTLNAIDYLEDNGKGVEFYVKELKDRANVGRWSYSQHIMPHDARNAHQGRAAESIADIFADLMGVDPVIVPKTSVQTGINRARLLIPRMWFDETKCADGIAALRSYRRQWDEDRKVFLKTPLHDQFSHGADAFRYGASAEPPTDAGFSKPIDYNKYFPQPI